MLTTAGGSLPVQERPLISCFHSSINTATDRGSIRRLPVDGWESGSSGVTTAKLVGFYLATSCRHRFPRASLRRNCGVPPAQDPSMSAAGKRRSDMREPPGAHTAIFVLHWDGAADRFDCSGLLLDNKLQKVRHGRVVHPYVKAFLMAGRVTKLIKPCASGPAKPFSSVAFGLPV
jgi:hypothetical protein